MKQEELFNFITNFNKIKFIPDAVIIEGLKRLPESDHKLFMSLVNYKNNGEFKSLLEDGEI